MNLPNLHPHPPLHSLDCALQLRSARKVVEDVNREVELLAPQMVKWDNLDLVDYNPEPLETLVIDARFRYRSVTYAAVELVQSEDGSGVVRFNARRTDGSSTAFSRENSDLLRFETVDAQGQSVVHMNSKGLLVSFQHQDFRPVDQYRLHCK